MWRLFIIVLLFVAAIIAEFAANNPYEFGQMMRKLPLPEMEWKLPGPLQDKMPAWTQPDPGGAREKVLNVARKEIGIRERTGRNDGEVEKYIRAAGLDPKKGHPYCAAFIYWCGWKAGYPKLFPRSAWSPDFVSNPNWAKGKGSTPEPGDVFGVYYRSKGRVAHAGFVERLRGKSIITIEANTSSRAAIGSAADREGQGVYRKVRPLSTVYAIKKWY